VIVWHLDRLYRQSRELEQLLDLLDSHPVRIESVQGGSFDLNRHEGRLFARQLVSFANYESAHKGARIARAQQHRAGSGLWHGRAAYGYLPGGRVHVTQSGVVQRIVDDYLVGISASTIARELTADGLPSPTGQPSWGETTIRSILRSDRLHRRRLDRSRQAEVPGQWDPIITPDESMLIQAILIAPRRDAARSSSSLLGGIARCSSCGNRLVAGVTSRGRRVYSCRSASEHCNARVADADYMNLVIESRVLAEIEQHTITSDRLADPNSLLIGLQSAREQLRTLSAAFGGGDLDRPAYLDQRRHPIAAIKSHAIDLAAHSSHRLLSTGADALRQRWKTASLSFRRALICAILTASAAEDRSPAATMLRPTVGASGPSLFKIPES